MKRFLIVLLVIFLLFIGALVAAPYFFKDKIMALVKTEINKNVNANVDFKDVSLSFFKSFPNLHLGVDNITVDGWPPFEDYRLADIEQFGLVVNYKALLDPENMEIKQIKVKKPKIHVVVLEGGKANYDIAKPSTSNEESEPANYTLAIQKYELKDADIIYDDRSAKTYAHLENLNHVGMGDFTQDLFTLKTNTTSSKMNISQGGIKYFSNTHLDAYLDIVMDMVGSAYTIERSNVKLNDLDIDLSGKIAMPTDDISMDLKFKSKETAFKKLLSLIPSMYTKDYKSIKADGNIRLEGFAKGIYNDKKYPAFELDIDVIDGEFSYPDLAFPVKNIQMDARINNRKDYLDATEVDLSKLHFTLEDEDFDLNGYVRTPMSDPQFYLKAKGKLNLDKVHQAYPMEGVSKLTGLADIDIETEGRQSDVDNERYEKIDLKGFLEIKDMEYESVDLPAAVKMEMVSMDFSPQKVAVNKAKGIIGKSDFTARGKFDNILAYAISDGELTGNFSVDSDNFDADEWMESTSTEVETETEEEAYVFLVPEKININLEANVKKVKYDNLDLTNIIGNVLVKDEAVVMKNIKANLLGGSSTINGTYDTKGKEKPDFDFNYSIKEFDIQESFEKFNTMQAIAPIAKYLGGTFSSEMNMNGSLDNTMAVLLSSLSGAGNALVIKGKLLNFEPFNKLVEKIQVKELNEVNDLDVKTRFKFEEGKVVVTPFDFESKGIKFDVSGNHGFDQSLDYNLKAMIPKNMIGNKINKELDSFLAKANSKGVPINLPDLIPVDIHIGGSITSPKITTDFKSLALGAGAMAKELFNTAKDSLERLAKEKLEEGKKLVKETTDQVKDKAQQELDKAKQQAEAKAKDVVNDVKDQVKTGAVDAIDKTVKTGVKDGADAIKDQVKGGIKVDSLGGDIKDKGKDFVKDLFGKKKKKP